MKPTPDPAPARPSRLVRACVAALVVVGVVIAGGGALGVSVAGLALSYDALRTVGEAANMRPEWSWLLPVSIDGAMAVASVVAVVIRQITGQTSRYAWCVVAAGVLISAACNGLHAVDTVELPAAARVLVSTIPAVMPALALHLVVVLIQVALDRLAARRQGDVVELVDVVDEPQAVELVDQPQLVVEPEAQPPLDAVELGDALPAPPAPPVVEPRPAPEPLPEPPPAPEPDPVDDQDQRAAARQRVAGGETCQAVAADLGVTARTVQRWTADLRADRTPVGASA